MQLEGFTLVTPQNAIIRPRLIMSIEGLEKEGKTHFAFTAPGPIAYHNFDKSLEGVVQKFLRLPYGPKEIHETIYPYDPDDGQKAAEKILDDYTKKYRASIRSARTVIVDTGSRLWSCYRLARLGRLTNVKGHHYGPVNAEFEAMISEAYSHGANVIFLHKRRDQYINDKATGEYERAGFGDMGFLVQINALAWREGTGIVKNGAFHVSVLDCAQNAAVAGLDLVGEMATFPMLAQFVLPEINPVEWLS